MDLLTEPAPAAAPPESPAHPVSMPGLSPELEKLRTTIKSGANWFYWIAGLSVVNSAVQIAGSTYSFIVGLGITQVFDALASGIAQEAGPGVGVFVRGVALMLDVVAVAVFAFLGWQAGKHRGWAFAVGIALYALDALIFLLVKEWLSFGFHLFALVGVWGGYSALRRLRAAEVQFGLRPVAPGQA